MKNDKNRRVEDLQKQQTKIVREKIKRYIIYIT